MEGVEIAMATKPDVVICDIVMPDMDGYAVYDALQDNEGTRNIRFIFSTAQSQKDEIIKARLAGVRCYLLKPFDDKELIACIESGASRELR